MEIYFITEDLIRRLRVIVLGNGMGDEWNGLGDMATFSYICREKEMKEMIV